MDFQSILNHLSGPAKENKIYFSEPEIQAQRDAVQKLKMSGVSQMVVEAQENRLREMEAKKQQPRDKEAIAKNTDFLSPTYTPANDMKSSFDVNVSDTTVPMNGNYDSVAPVASGTPAPELPPVQPEMPPMPPKAPTPPAAGGPATPPMADKSVKDLMSMGDMSNDDQARRDQLGQDERKNRLAMLFPKLLAGAGDVITASGAPLGTKATNGLESIVKTEKEGEKTRKEDLEKSLLTDPKSGMSKVAQQAAARLLGKKPEELEGLSLAQIDKAFPIWKEALNNEQAMELKKLQIEALKAQKEMASSSKNEQFKERQIQQIRQNLTSGKGFQNMQAIDYNGRIINDSLKNPNGYADLGAMFAFMKALDPTSVVREGEQDIFKATGSLPTHMANILNKWATGKTLQPEQRKQVADFAQKMRGHALEQYKQGAKPSIEQAKRLGYNLSEIDPMFEDASSATSDTSGKSVVKKQYSKSANKTKLIYSDGSEEIVDGQK